MRRRPPGRGGRLRALACGPSSKLSLEFSITLRRHDRPEQHIRMPLCNRVSRLHPCVSQQGDLKARELYEEARRGGYAKATVNLSVLCKQQGDVLQARGLYDEARRGGCAHATFNLGGLYKQQGDLLKARELLGGGTPWKMCSVCVQPRHLQQAGRRLLQSPRALRADTPLRNR